MKRAQHYKKQEKTRRMREKILGTRQDIQDKEANQESNSKRRNKPNEVNKT
jgi:hypothetical protein